MAHYGQLPILLLSELAAGHADSADCRIATYLLAHLDDASEITVERVAAACAVSNGSVSRFCRNIGLDGFAELRALMRREGRAFTVYGSGLEAAAQSAVFAGCVEESLRLVTDTLDYAALDRLVDALCSAGRIAVFGLLKSGTAAMNLQGDLSILGFPAVTRLTFHEQSAFLRDIRRGDLVLLLSYTGLYLQYDLPPRMLDGTSGAKVWLVTSRPEAAAQYPALSVLRFDSKRDFASNPFQMQLVASIIAQRCAARKPGWLHG